MKRPGRTSRMAVVAGLALALLSSAGTPVAAHSPGGKLYGARWHAARGQVPFWFTDSVPRDVAFRERVLDGVRVWNGLGQPFAWRELPRQRDHDPLTCAFHGATGIHWRDFAASGINPAFSGATSIISTAGGVAIDCANVVLNRSERWWLQAVPPPDGTWADLASVATHEFGHAAGFASHWETAGYGAYCRPGVRRHTMCQTSARGYSWERSLELHDVDTFANAY